MSLAPVLFKNPKCVKIHVEGGYFMEQDHDFGFLDEQEAERFFKKLVSKLREYSGVYTTYEIDYKKGEFIKFSIWLEVIKGLHTEFLNPLATNLDTLVQLIKYYNHKYSKIHPTLINSLIKDLSLSYIFDEYNILEEEKAEKYESLINDINNIGAKTYEGKKADLGVIYYPNKKALDQLKKLDLEIINLPEEKSVRAFFDEKPFLRLIDNMTFAILINPSLKIEALVRKKNSGKSVNHVLEEKFNDHFTSIARQSTLNYLFELVEQKSKPEDKGILEKAKRLYEKPAEIPQYIYFSLKDTKINIYTNKHFVLTYYHGEWKLKDYCLLRSVIAKFIIEIHETMFIMLDRFNNLFDKINNFALKLKRLSESNTSSIILIDSRKLDNDSERKTELKDLEINNLIRQDGGNALCLHSIENITNKNANLNVNEIDYFFMETICSVDGALIIDSNLNIVSFGKIINNPARDNKENEIIYGTGTSAALQASKNKVCLAIKISEDGDIIFFNDGSKQLLI